ncbi:tyrosine-type recombinase/integrase [Hyphococcus sp. DH-69]|uniref:tyrosine-type recombinase/integrase n=1 Tax=Hyphococcus formosus TaxID=3143534 RepID=UPI00398B7485
MFIVVKNLQFDGSKYSYRKAVPKDLRSIIGKREWVFKKRFKGLSPSQAMAEAERLNARLQLQIDTFRNDRDTIVNRKQAAEDYIRDHPDLLDKKPLKYGYTNQQLAIEELVEDFPGDLADPNDPNSKILNPPPQFIQDVISAAQNDGTLIPETHKLSDIFHYYISHRYDGVAPKEAKFALKSFVDYFSNIDLRLLSRTQVKRWAEHCDKKLGNSPATIKRRLAVGSAMVNRYILDFELDTELTNPFKGLGLSAPHTGEEKLPFNEAHLNAIDAYLNESRISNQNKAFLMLMKYTGAGLTELAGLEQRDVTLSGDVPFINIRINKLRPMLKTSARPRRIPLVKKAKNILTSFKTGETSDPFWGKEIDPHSLSAALNKAIRAAGVPKSKRITVNCFRHTLEQAMRTTNATELEQKAILGHSKRDTTQKYGAPTQDLKKLLKILNKAHRKLGKVHLDIYTEDELISEQQAPPKNKPKTTDSKPSAIKS